MGKLVCQHRNQLDGIIPERGIVGNGRLVALQPERARGRARLPHKRHHLAHAQRGRARLRHEQTMNVVKPGMPFYMREHVLGTGMSFGLARWKESACRKHQRR